MIPAVIYLTGSNGFLGASIANAIRSRWPHVALQAIPSPSQGGPQLDSDDAETVLERYLVPQSGVAAIIHAAACVNWNEWDGLCSNARMAWTVAGWAKRIGAESCVLISGVNVYPHQAHTTHTTPPAPPTAYGIGKVAAEMIWANHLGAARSVILRMAGLWGWQKKPTLFWNHLLWAATGAGEPPVANRLKSWRNYISVQDAAECTLSAIEDDLSGTLTAAGTETVSVGEYLEELGRLPGAVPHWKIQDDGGEDTLYYEPSPPLIPYLSKDWRSTLRSLWKEHPHVV